jgi:hypothetical protein
LVENADAAIVSGLICKRLFPYESIVYKCTPDGELQQCQINAVGKVLDVDACAFGCTLINIDFLVENYEKGKIEKPFFFDKSMRSDLNFCMSMRKLGGKVLLDTRVEVGHITEPSVVTFSNAQAMREDYLKSLGKLS